MDCTIDPNHDLVGIGTRIPIYILSLVVPLARLAFPGSLGFDIINAILGVVWIILFVTSIVATYLDSLDLFHAVCVAFLLSIAWPGNPRPYDDDEFSGPKNFHALLNNVFSPLLYYIFLDMVFGNLDTFGPNQACNPRVRISLFGASISAAAPSIPWVISILLAATMLTALANSCRAMGVAPQLEGMVASLLEAVDPRRIVAMANDNYRLTRISHCFHMKWADVTPFQCTASILTRVYFIASLEHTIFLNGAAAGHGMRDIAPWQKAAIVAVVVVIVVGRLTCNNTERANQREEDDIQSWIENGFRGGASNLSAMVTQRIPEWDTAMTSPSQDGDGMKLQLRLMLSPTDHYLIFVLMGLLDAASSALAGVLGALAAKSASRNPPSVNFAQLGALAGAVKSLGSSLVLLLFTASPSNLALVPIFTASSFIVTLAVTAVVAQRTLHEVPDGLLSAALAAGAPLLLSNAMYLPDVLPDQWWWIGSLVFDTLGGLTFAKVAQNHGINSFSGGVGAVAVLVFSLVFYWIKLVTLMFVGLVEESMVGTGARSMFAGMQYGTF